MGVCIYCLLCLKPLFLTPPPSPFTPNYLDNLIHLSILILIDAFSRKPSQVHKTRLFFFSCIACLFFPSSYLSHRILNNHQCKFSYTLLLSQTVRPITAETTYFVWFLYRPHFIQCFVHTQCSICTSQINQTIKTPKMQQVPVIEMPGFIQYRKKPTN